MNLGEIVALSVKHNASDLHLCPGQVPNIRTDGLIRPLEYQPPVAPAFITGCALHYLGRPGNRSLIRSGQADCAIAFEDGSRLRAHFFMQHFGMSASFRLIRQHCQSLAQLGVPSAVGQLLAPMRGLMLVTGPAGSGKSSSLAAMLDDLNQHRQAHIITLEDPIEHLHRPGRCLVQQREIGRHCTDFRVGIHGALREDPDVIMLGELRDGQTIRLALNAAETGHLVLATLHADHPAQAVDRLIEGAGAREPAFVRSQVAAGLLAVMSQKLVGRPEGGRCGEFELMVATPAVRNLIREGKSHLLAGLTHGNPGQ